MMDMLEELVKSRDAISQRIWKIESQRRDLANAAYIGKYFVYENGYNSRDKWPMYIHAKAIKSGSVVCDWFQTDCNGEFSCRRNDTRGAAFLADGKQITKAVYERAFAKALKKISP